jgi:hypothetical protein
MKRLLVLGLLLVLAGCASDPALLLSGGTGTARATIGSPSRTVVSFVQLRPGDRLELLSADGVGSLDGTDVQFFFSPPVVSSNGDRTIGELLEPFPGASFAADPGASPGPDNTVGIVAQMTPRTAGVFQLTSVRVHLRLNGGAPEVREVALSWTVCAADPAPVMCDTPASP